MTQQSISNETQLSPKYGSEIARFGRWIATSKGIVTQKNLIEPEDFFIDNTSLFQLSSIRKLFDELIKESWLDTIDYHEFITSWFYKLSLTKINPDPDEPGLAETLEEIQSMLEKKFAGRIS